MTTTNSRRPSRTQATKEKLFSAAMELMGETGVAETRVEDVAARAGVSKGSVYYNFGSKDQMVEELMRFGLEHLEERLAADRPEAADPLSVLEAALSSGFAFLEEYPSFGKLWMAQSWQGSERWGSAPEELRERMLGLLTGMVSAVAPSAPSADVRATTIALFGSIFTLSLSAGRYLEGMGRTELVRVCLLPARALAHLSARS